MIRRLAVAAAFVAAAMLPVVPVHGTAPVRDHLQCFKIKDASAKAEYTADLLPDHATFPRLEPGCTIRTPAKQICIDVAGSNVQPAPPDGVSGKPGQVYLCYKASCSKLSTTLDATDRFGVHALEVKSTTMVCAPVAGACANGIEDGDETDVDCGGSCSGCDDGDACLSGSDCASGVCGPGFVCASGCGAGFADCDGLAENGCEADLGSDSSNCGTCGISVSTGNECLQGACVDGAPQAFPAPAGTPCQQGTGHCDGNGNCLSCASGQFRCAEGTCIEAFRECDGAIDCPDGSDEAPASCGGGCGAGQFACYDGVCISAASECDGIPDCGDGSDESPYDPACLEVCLAGMFHCADGVCIPALWECDGYVDCADASDESPANPVCGGGGGCGPGQFTCWEGLCIDGAWTCDGVQDCPDGSDEAPMNPLCSGGCAIGDFTCLDGTCIPSTMACDTVPDCPDGSDEAPWNSCPVNGCPGGATVADWCWYLGAPGAGCVETCASHGGVYDGATATFAGSSGIDENCLTVLDFLEAPAGTLPHGSGPAGFGIGCALLSSSLGETMRYRDTSPTTAEGALSFAMGLAQEASRACACTLALP